jgi:hypothetical protein
VKTSNLLKNGIGVYAPDLGNCALSRLRRRIVDDAADQFRQVEKYAGVDQGAMATRPGTGEGAKKPRPKDTEREVLLFHGCGVSCKTTVSTRRQRGRALAGKRIAQRSSRSCKILGHAHRTAAQRRGHCYFRFFANRKTPPTHVQLATAATQAQDFASSRQAYEAGLCLCCEQHQPCHYSEP